MYNDNPKYVSIKLHEKYPNYRIIWTIGERSHEEFPNYVETVKVESLAYYKWSFQAHVMVDNMDGIRSDVAPNRVHKKGMIKKLYKKCFRFFVPLRRKKQFNFSTWHGTPLKRIGRDRFDIPQSEFGVKHGSCDAMLAGCELTKNCLKSAHFFGYSVPFHMYGTPRNDILFDKSINIGALKGKLHLPLDKRIILFAPTFRDDDLENSGIRQMSEIDFNRLFEVLHNKFGGDWYFVFRVHAVVVTKINTEKLTAEYGERIIDGNIGDDMAEYLVCSDILMTDYSSSMFDFALTKRPCLLFCPDKKHYENDVRGFYFSMDELPFPISYDNESLQSCISAFDQKEYEQKVDAFLEKIGNVEDGNASEKVVEDIKYFLDTGIKR